MRAGRRTRSLAAIALSGVVCSCASPSRRSDGAQSHPYVVVVSLDAFRADYLDRHQPPALLELSRRGVRADAMIPAFPSKTFPNHYALVTGLYPGHHGIVGNAFFDPERRAWYRSNTPAAVVDSSWYGGEPIWVTAERNGVKAAAYFWPGSEAAIGGVRPSYSMAYDGSVRNEQRVNGVIAWLRKSAAERPHLALVYFSEVDDTTHRYGPDAPQTAVAVRDVDRALRVLLDSIRALPIADSVNVVVVSDHGMTETSPSRVIGVSELLGADTTGIEVSDNGPTLSLWFSGDALRVSQALSRLRGTPHMQAYARNEIPERWHMRGIPRIGDILLVAEEGWILQRRASDKAPARGAHGYDPVLPNMQATFVAAGPNIRSLGRIPAFENVNVYPFLAALLRLQRVPRVDGDIGVLGPLVR